MPVDDNNQGYRRVVRALRRQAELADDVAAAIESGTGETTVLVPDEVIRNAFLELYRQRHPGVPEPRVVIKAKE